MNKYVALSGGIDSTALALLEPDAQLIFTDTGWEFPELYQQLDHFERVTGREIMRLKWDKYPGGLPEYIEKSKFMPGHAARYCTDKFKIQPMNRWLKDNLPCELHIALRADEPARVGNLTELEGLTIRYPLREKGYTRLDCVRLCAESDLLPRYPVYMARGGCVGCFYKRKSEVQAMAVLTPEILDQLQALEEGVQDERGSYAVMFPNTGQSIRNIRGQGLLFTPEEVYQQAADKTDYGDNCGLFCNR